MLTGTLAFAQVVSSCRQSPARFRVALLDGSVPIQLIQEFRRRSGQPAIEFIPKEQLSDLYSLLQSWETQPDEAASPLSPETTRTRPAQLMTLGDYWLTDAIRQRWIQPWDVQTVPGWQVLAEQPLWQTLVRRDQQGQPSAEGSIWAAPYRWGTLMIAYRRDRFNANGWQPPTDWEDLWRPELKRQISILDSPRAVMGLTLKRLGQSVNPDGSTTVTELSSALQALHQQVKLYSSDSYLHSLVVGDAPLAVGWSTEILPLLKRDQRIAAVVPASGTILTADLWVQPVIPSGAESDAAIDANTSELLNQWLAFCWEYQIATQLSLLSAGASPILYGVERSQLPSALQQNDLLLPSFDLLQQSEFLLPLSDAMLNRLSRLWVEVRTER